MHTYFFVIITLLFCSALIDLKFFLDQTHHAIVNFIDVQQGDATLLRTKTNCTLLIDGGPPGNLLQQIRFHTPLLSRKIDLVVLTHPHLDHLAGLYELQKRFTFHNLLITGANYPLKEYQQLVAESKNITYLTEPITYNLCGTLVHFLMPLTSQIGQSFTNINNSSIIVLIETPTNKLLITGDAELEQEAELIHTYSSELMNIDILKAGHHGSKTSTSRELLQLTTPKHLIISAGENNRYNHPHSETLLKAEQFNLKLYRTDIDGTVKFELPLE